MTRRGRLMSIAAEANSKDVALASAPVPPQSAEPVVEGWRIMHSSGETVVTRHDELVRELKSKPGARAFRLKKPA